LYTLLSPLSFFYHLKTTTSIQYNKLLECWLTSELIYFTELTTEKSGKKELKMKMNMLRSIVKRSGESMESVLKKKLNKEEAVPSPPSPPPLSLSHFLPFRWK